MQQFEQDWLELGGRVARSLHYQHPRNLRLLQTAQAKPGGDRPGPPPSEPRSRGPAARLSADDT